MASKPHSEPETMDAAQRLGEWLEHERTGSDALRNYDPRNDIGSLLEQLETLRQRASAAETFIVQMDMAYRYEEFRETWESNPASGRTISATITGDGSGVALPLITEGFGPPRTWNPSGGAGSSTASSADDAGAEEPSPASDPFDAGGQVTHVHDPASEPEAS